MTILKLKNGNRKKCHNVFSKDEDKSGHTEEIRKIISSDMGNVQRWGLPLLFVVVILCFMLLYLIRIPVGDNIRGSVRLIVLLMQVL